MAEESAAMEMNNSPGLPNTSKLRLTVTYASLYPRAIVKKLSRNTQTNMEFSRDDTEAEEGLKQLFRGSCSRSENMPVSSWD